MLGKTHLAVGLAVSLAVVHPQTLPELVVGIGAAAVGSVVSDIDVGTSDSHKDAVVMVAMTVISVLAVYLIERFFNIGIYEMIQADSSLNRVVTGGVLFAAVCGYGLFQPHRSFMHSFLACAILTALVWVVIPKAVWYFAVGFLSHLLTDLFNYKQVRLLYPMEKGLCFKLFHAKGVANTVLFAAGGLISLGLIIAHFVKVFEPLQDGLLQFFGVSV